MEMRFSTRSAVGSCGFCHVYLYCAGARQNWATSIVRKKILFILK